MTPDFRRTYLRDILKTYRTYKSMGDRALAQVADTDLRRLIDPDANSIAIIVKHQAGNLRSRFTDFLTTDGEKPDRNRDAEFETTNAATRQKRYADIVAVAGTGGYKSRVPYGRTRSTDPAG